MSAKSQSGGNSYVLPIRIITTPQIVSENGKVVVKDHVQVNKEERPYTNRDDIANATLFVIGCLFLIGILITALFFIQDLS